MVLDAKEVFARQETTPREICQQLKKKDVVQAKTAPKFTAHKFRWLPGVGTEIPAYGHSSHQDLVHRRRRGPQNC